MEILSHRGLWDHSFKKNSLEALIQSLYCGFGFETDVRDLNGELVVSHDPPLTSDLLLATLLEKHREVNPGLTLALNIKSDGLQTKLKEALFKFGTKNYFVFDMSVPDAVGYHKSNFNFFTRQSDIEREPVLYEAASGVWLDSFWTDWLTEKVLEKHLRFGKSVCIVSPELHGRDHTRFWSNIADWDVIKENNIMICTDHPVEARRKFNDEN